MDIGLPVLLRFKIENEFKVDEIPTIYNDNYSQLEQKESI